MRTETATTEQLREAMIRYRALFEDLTGLKEGSGQPSATVSRRSATAPPDCRHRRCVTETHDLDQSTSGLTGTKVLRRSDNDLAAERPDRGHASIGAQAIRQALTPR